jgi:SagB-type dehydrogenase family enzyme
MLKATARFYRLTQNKLTGTPSFVSSFEPSSEVFRKSYPRFPSTQLDAGAVRCDALNQLLDERVSTRAFSGTPLRFDVLSALLQTCRIVDPARQPERRTYPSAGARFPIEIYVIAFAVERLAPDSVYHYEMQSGVLEHLWALPGQHPRSTLVTPYLDNPSLLIVLTAAIVRAEMKYGYKAYPFSYLEAGHIGQTLQLGCAELGIGACSIGGFTDSVIAEALDLSADEIPIYAIGVGEFKAQGKAQG